MELAGNTVLVTGGGAGIGLALAGRFIGAGSRVIVCGRREDKLQAARDKFPSLEVRVCDLSVASERRSLFEWIKADFPELNVLVNNAGIQHRINLWEADAGWDHYHREIQTNLEAPIHLCLLFLPFLAGKRGAAIVNVSSGLAFTPGALAPIYSATKAGLHSFTMSLRHQAAGKNVGVVEIAPPAVNTDLGGAGLHTFGVPLDEFADAVFEGLRNGDPEIGYGTSKQALRMSRDEIDETFRRMNSRI